jgi:HD-GYP domain-containing protein (c-di-GMP phosphodiesterase class II)
MKNNQISIFKKTQKSNKLASLAVRLTVWFLILSTLPLVVMMVFIQGNISNQLRQTEIDMEQRRNKEIAASISQQVQVENILPILKASSSPDKTFYAINNSGEIIFHPDGTKIGQQAKFPKDSDYLNRMNSAIDGYFITPDARVIISFTPIPHLNLFLISENRNPAIISSINQLETKSTIQLGVSLFIISIIAGIIIWIVVGKPIQELTKVAVKISEGDLSQTVNLESMNDELLVLGNVFNHMTEQLKDTILGLETNLHQLQETQSALKSSENRYRTIFETASVCLWEEDYTEFFKRIQQLRDEGVTNFREYFDQNPDFLINAFACIKILDVNQETVKLYEAESKEELLGSLDRIYTPELLEVFKEEAIAISNGAKYFESEIPNLTLKGNKIQTLMRITLPETRSDQRLMLVSIMDITDQKQNSLRIQKQVEHLSALRQIDLAITSHLDLRSIINLLLSQIRRQLKVDAVNVLKFNPHLNYLHYISSTGFRTNALQNTRLRLGDGFSGRAALERKPLFIQDLSEQSNPFTHAPYFFQEGFVSYYGIPLIAKGEIKGVLEIFNRSPLSINAEWEEFIKDLATQGALAIDAASLWEEQQRINEELKIAYDSTLKGWSFALELHDYETFGHSDRVTDRTVRLAQKMGVRQDQLIHIRRGSILHDIGKMGVPESILNKKEKLSESDWKIIREHPLYARRLLEPIDFLKEAVDIPYYHHEWWNGGGYPEGLMKEQIPLAARIFAVIDVWDALSYPRPYRDAWPKEKVYQYIKDLSGIQFDPQVVSAFLEMLTEEEQERID